MVVGRRRKQGVDGRTRGDKGQDRLRGVAFYFPLLLKSPRSNSLKVHPLLPLSNHGLEMNGQVKAMWSSLVQSCLNQ